MENQNLLELWKNEGIEIKKHLGKKDVRSRIMVANNSQDWNDKIQLMMELYLETNCSMPESSLEIIKKTDLGVKLYYAFLAGLI